jgi:DNA topoisomerase-1
MKLVVVESPAKCAKIQSYLGDGYKVQATMGHIRALEESLDSVGIDKGWEPTFAEIKTKKEAIAKLRAAAKGCEVILAADDDREGEAIAWHVCFILKLNPATTQRIVFHEITKPAILAAAASPRRLDMNKVNAQQARSMLDLLVGFTISKVLWNRVGPKLSAGRCQTPALRLVVERDAEVDNHKAAAYWRLSGSWRPTTTGTLPSLEAVAAVDLATQDEAQKVLQGVVHHTASTVVTVKESVSTSSPPKPLITSTLQQEASNQCGINPKTTMQAAQKLYEAGHITYMRTDNPLISDEAATVIRSIVKERYGEDYVGAPGQHILQAAPEPKEAKEAKESKKAKAPDTTAQPQAQAAHEAIRPTHPEVEPDIDDPTQKRVYRLIWRRAMESQMSPSQTDVKKATLVINADKERVWNTEQTKMKFAGWKVLEPKSDDVANAEVAAWTAWAPYLKPGTALQWQQLRADEQFTKPKGRYTEASLISDLEKRGIGRPSTFASLVSTILERKYVEKTNAEGKTQESTHLLLKPTVWPPTVKTEAHKVGADKNKLKATPLGKSVSDFLAREYTDLFNYQFTATMEQRLDEIAQGTHPWKSLLQTTWDTYKERYAEQTSGPSRASKERELAPGVKVILSKKGPLFVKEPPAGSPKTAKATFASLPSSTTFETANLVDAEAAFTSAAQAKAGELIGHLEADEIRKKTGPYGQYAECKGSRVPLKGDETLEQIQEKLTAKIGFATGTDVSGAVVTAFDRTVGDYRIKRGPYGLYFYKPALKRATFIKFPPQLDPAKVTLADLNGLYSVGLANKRKFGKK